MSHSRRVTLHQWDLNLCAAYAQTNNLDLPKLWAELGVVRYLGLPTQLDGCLFADDYTVGTHCSSSGKLALPTKTTFTSDFMVVAHANNQQENTVTVNIWAVVTKTQFILYAQRDSNKLWTVPDQYHHDPHFLRQMTQNPMVAITDLREEIEKLKTAINLQSQRIKKL